MEAVCCSGVLVNVLPVEMTQDPRRLYLHFHDYSMVRTVSSSTLDDASLDMDSFIFVCQLGRIGVRPEYYSWRY
jgi:hypothetical protein